MDVNWGIRFTTMEEVEEFMKSLSTELQSRLTKAKTKGRTITLKVIFLVQYIRTVTYILPTFCGLAAVNS